MNFEYMSQPPKRYTFEQPKLRLWTEGWCKDSALVLNLFAGKTKLSVNETRVDINPDMPADYHMDAFDFISSWKGKKFDVILLDPPYNVRKSREKYKVGEKTFYIGKLKKIKDSIHNILNKDGIIIHFGYDSVGMGKQRGFKKIGICLVCHNGDHNDTICVVDKFTSYQMTF